MIVTPPALHKLMKDCTFLLNNTKLKFVAFENIDCIYAKHEDICKEIIQKVCSIKMNPIQMIITSCTWQPFLRRLIDDEKVLIIGNFLEAAMYARVNISLEFRESDKKLDKTYGEFIAICSL